MSAKPCDNCKMIMVNYADLWLVHTRVASRLKGAKSELRELKARSLLLGGCTSFPVLKSDLEANAVEIKELKHKLDHSSPRIPLLKIQSNLVCAPCHHGKMITASHSPVNTVMTEQPR
jgi:hypothetical protein